MELVTAPPLRFRGLWIGGACALVATLVFLCLLPAARVPDVGLSDVVEHTAGYLVLMLWFAGLLSRARWLPVAAALIMLGVGLEWLQGSLDLGRVSDPRDVVANSLGVALGLGLSRAGLGGWMRWIETHALRV